MPVLECSIAPPDESGEKLEKEYPALKYFILALLFYLVSKFRFLGFRKNSGKTPETPTDVNKGRHGYS